MFALILLIWTLFHYQSTNLLLSPHTFAISWVHVTLAQYLSWCCAFTGICNDNVGTVADGNEICRNEREFLFPCKPLVGNHLHKTTTEQNESMTTTLIKQSNPVRHAKTGRRYIYQGLTEIFLQTEFSINLVLQAIFYSFFFSMLVSSDVDGYFTALLTNVPGKRNYNSKFDMHSFNTQATVG